MWLGPGTNKIQASKWLDYWIVFFPLPLSCPDGFWAHVVLNKCLAEAKVFDKNPLPQYYMVSLQKEVFRNDPWSMLIVYADSKHDKPQVTAYRLAKLEFSDYETAFYAEYLSAQSINHVEFFDLPF